MGRPAAAGVQGDLVQGGQVRIERKSPDSVADVAAVGVQEGMCCGPRLFATGACRSGVCYRAVCQFVAGSKRCALMHSRNSLS